MESRPRQATTSLHPQAAISLRQHRSKDYALKGGALTEAAKAMDAAGVKLTDDDDSSSDQAVPSGDAKAS
jgi:hypothetical protein